MSGDKPPQISTWPMVATVAAVVVLWGLWAAYLLPSFLPERGQPERLGQFGDSFGVVNALFAAITLIVVVMTYRSQREELKDQRKELQLQRQEVENTRKVMARQAFEATFFQLLTQLRELKLSIHVTQSHGTNSPGEQSIRLLWSIIQQYHANNRTVMSVEKSEMWRAAIPGYKEALGHTIGSFGIYYTSFMAIVRFIEESGQDVERALYYDLLVSSQSAIFMGLLGMEASIAYGEGIVHPPFLRFAKAQRPFSLTTLADNNGYLAQVLGLDTARP